MPWPFSFQQTTVGVALLCAAVAVLRGPQKPGGLRLEDVIAKLLAGSSIPTGLYLMACAFDTSLVAMLTELGLYLAAAGLALLYVSVKELWAWAFRSKSG